MRLPTLDQWNELTKIERDTIARSIEDHTGGQFRCVDTHRYKLGEHAFQIARFDFEGSLFVFVPGGQAKLGFAARSFTPTPEQKESWQGTARDYGIEQTVNEYVDDLTTLSRRVRVAPMLVEVEAREIGLEPIQASDPEVQNILKSEGRKKGPSSYEIHKRLRVTWDGKGKVEAFRIRSVTRTALARQVRALGFRLPTADEWEYLCGAGARTLFRWGSMCPCDRYPTDINRKEAAWRRAWVLSGGKMERPKKPFKRDWDLHVCPNAFGLLIASNPYDCEIVTDPPSVRGGDGGGMICGGAGFFVGWLPLATAYVDPGMEEHFKDHVTGAYMRRVKPI